MPHAPASQEDQAPTGLLATTLILNIKKNIQLIPKNLRSMILLEPNFFILFYLVYANLLVGSIS